jgi:PPM family protein phosphatase
MGYVRNTNEDRIYVPENGSGSFIAVADGMGGHRAGEIASGIVVDTLSDLLGNSKEITADSIKNALMFANNKVLDDSNNNHAHRGMGSTATVAAFNKNEVIIGHVGDSRAYLFSKGVLKQITKDHSYVQMLLDNGYITQTQAYNHPYKNIITKSIGIDDEIDVDIYNVKLSKGDSLLLCTDGLNAVVSDEEIAAVLSKNIETAAEELVEMSLRFGGPDNISVVIASMDGDFA